MSTSDPDEAHEWLRGSYAPHSVLLSGNRTHFRARHLDLDVAPMNFGMLEHSMAVEIDASPVPDSVIVERVLTGQLTLSDGATELSPTQNDSFLINPDAAQHITWQPGVRLEILRLPRTAVDQFAAEMTGQDQILPLGFPLSTPLSPQKQQAWQGLLRHLSKEFTTHPATYDSPLIRTETARFVVAMLLQTFPSTALNADPSRLSCALPTAMRRAVDFIERSASDDISLTEIAAAARTGVRALQQAFRRNLNTTPLAYLRRTRLARAHAELRSADPTSGVTVIEVATRWGFSNPGRFAAEYRRKYGRNPHVTLHT
jgi:AraC-like DNA-binding protein